MAAGQVQELFVHPEDALDRIREGTQTGEDLHTVSEHCELCVICAEELAVIHEGLREVVDDDPMAQRIAAAALGANDQAWAHIGRQVGAVMAPGLPPPEVSEAKAAARQSLLPRPWTRWLSSAAGILLALTLGSGLAAAAVWISRGLLSEEEPPASTPATTQPPRPTARVAEVAEPAPAPAPAPEPEPESAPAPEPESAPAPEPEVLPASEPGPHRAERNPSADDLLARANRARQGGRHSESAALYRTIQRRFPGSRAQAVSRVALGRLYLNHLRSPRRALREFDRYIAQHGSGPLVEEARVGRALALERLGRRRSARTAWQGVLRHHPDSINAERARQRFEHLGANH